MKNYLKILVFGLVTILFIGCGANLNPTKNDIQNAIKIKKTSDKNTYQVTGSIPGIDYNNVGVPTKLVHIKKLAEFGKEKGFKYFALIDDNFNNVLGLPVTDIEAGRIICSMRCTNNVTITKAIFFHENPNAFPVWNIEKIVNSNIDITDIYTKNDLEKTNLKMFLDFYKY